MTRKEKYNILRGSGLSAKDAHRFRDWAWPRIQKIMEQKRKFDKIFKYRIYVIKTTPIDEVIDLDFDEL